jgi:hypothetical protein
MKLFLRISILLNLALLGGLIYFVATGRKESVTIKSPLGARITNSTQPAAVLTPAVATSELPKPFHWKQLVSTDDYRIYVANLRAIGCPEPTIRDIVSGDAARAFAIRRAQLGLDGSGSGPWSRQQEDQLVAGLLGKQPLVAGNSAPAHNAEGRVQQNTGTQNSETSTSTQSAANGMQQNGGTKVAEASGSTQSAEQTAYQNSSAGSFPQVFQNVNLDALGLTADQKVAVQQAEQQFVNDMGSPSQNPSDPAYQSRLQTAQSNREDALRESLGNQGYTAYEQQLYYDWYQPQVEAASSGATVTINPSLFGK